MRHLRLRTWSGAERPLGFRRMARIRAWMQWAIAETCAMRHATNSIRRMLEDHRALRPANDVERAALHGVYGDAFWHIDDGATRPFTVYRAHRHAYLPARFRAREKLA